MYQKCPFRMQIEYLSEDLPLLRWTRTEQISWYQEVLSVDTVKWDCTPLVRSYDSGQDTVDGRNLLMINCYAM